MVWGHLTALCGVLLFVQYDDVPFVVNVAGRFNMKRGIKVTNTWFCYVVDPIQWRLSVATGLHNKCDPRPAVASMIRA
jgi:hypothetical protein